MLRHFLGVVVTTPDWAQRSTELLSWAHDGVGLSGRQPLRSDRRSADSLPLQLLQVPYPAGHARLQTGRRARKIQDSTVACGHLPKDHRPLFVLLAQHQSISHRMDIVTEQLAVTV